MLIFCSMILIANLPIDVHYYFANITQYLKRRRLPYVIVSTLQELKQVRSDTISHIILPGSEAYMSELDKHPRLRDLLGGISKLPSSIPRIGICFGAQYLYTYAGGKLERLKRGICSHRKIQSTALPITKARFCLHEVPMKPAPPHVEYIAWAQLQGQVRPCAFTYTNRPWYGFFFHPEADVETWTILDTVINKPKRET